MQGVAHRVNPAENGLVGAHDDLAFGPVPRAEVCKKTGHRYPGLRFVT